MGQIDLDVDVSLEGFENWLKFLLINPNVTTFLSLFDSRRASLKLDT